MKISTVIEYKNALARIDFLMDSLPNTPEEKELDILSDAVVKYEEILFSEFNFNYLENAMLHGWRLDMHKVGDLYYIDMRHNYGFRHNVFVSDFAELKTIVNKMVSDNAEVTDSENL